MSLKIHNHYNLIQMRKTYLTPCVTCDVIYRQYVINKPKCDPHAEV